MINNWTDTCQIPVGCPTNPPPPPPPRSGLTLIGACTVRPIVLVLLTLVPRVFVPFDQRSFRQAMRSKERRIYEIEYSSISFPELRSP